MSFSFSIIAATCRCWKFSGCMVWHGIWGTYGLWLLLLMMMMMMMMMLMMMMLMLLFLLVVLVLVLVLVWLIVCLLVVRRLLLVVVCCWLFVAVVVDDADVDVAVLVGWCPFLKGVRCERKGVNHATVQYNKEQAQENCKQQANWQTDKANCRHDRELCAL